MRSFAFKPFTFIEVNAGALCPPRQLDGGRDKRHFTRSVYSTPAFRLMFSGALAAWRQARLSVSSCRLLSVAKVTKGELFFLCGFQGAGLGAAFWAYPFSFARPGNFPIVGLEQTFFRFQRPPWHRHHGNTPAPTGSRVRPAHRRPKPPPIGFSSLSLISCLRYSRALRLMSMKQFTIFFLGFITRRAKNRVSQAFGLHILHNAETSYCGGSRRSVSCEKRGSWMPASRRHPTWRQGGQFLLFRSFFCACFASTQLCAWLRRHQIQPFCGLLLRPPLAVPASGFLPAQILR